MSSVVRGCVVAIVGITNLDLVSHYLLLSLLWSKVPTLTGDIVDLVASPSPSTDDGALLEQFRVKILMLFFTSLGIALFSAGACVRACREQQVARSCVLLFSSISQRKLLQQQLRDTPLQRQLTKTINPPLLL